jgi:hypothetical protein
LQVVWFLATDAIAEPEVLLPRLQEPPPVLILSQINQFKPPIPLSEDPF